MEIASRSEHFSKMVGGTIAFRDHRVPAQVTSGSGPAQLESVGPTIANRDCSSRTSASMAYEYRVTEAEDGTFPVELWSSQGESRQLIYKTHGFQTRELAEAWMVPVQVRSRAGEPRARVVYLKPERSRVNVPNPLRPRASLRALRGF